MDTLQKTDISAPKENFWDMVCRFFSTKSPFRFSNGTRMTRTEALMYALLPRPFQYKYVSGPFAGAFREILVVMARNQTEADAIVTERYLLTNSMAQIVPEYAWTKQWENVQITYVN